MPQFSSTQYRSIGTTDTLLSQLRARAQRQLSALGSREERQLVTVCLSTAFLGSSTFGLRHVMSAGAQNCFQTSSRLKTCASLPRFSLFMFTPLPVAKYVKLQSCSDQLQSIPSQSTIKGDTPNPEILLSGSALSPPNANAQKLCREILRRADVLGPKSGKLKFTSNVKISGIEN